MSTITIKDITKSMDSVLVELVVKDGSDSYRAVYPRAYDHVNNQGKDAKYSVAYPQSNLGNEGYTPIICLMKHVRRWLFMVPAYQVDAFMQKIPWLIQNERFGDLTCSRKMTSDAEEFADFLMDNSVLVETFQNNWDAEKGCFVEEWHPFGVDAINEGVATNITKQGSQKGKVEYSIVKNLTADFVQLELESRGLLYPLTYEEDADLHGVYSVALPDFYTGRDQEEQALVFIENRGLRTVFFVPRLNVPSVVQGIAWEGASDTTDRVVRTARKFTKNETSFRQVMQDMKTKYRHVEVHGFM